jgi:L-ascorbate metabolism protein UlaG (beta-lactamase superfamily)
VPPPPAGSGGITAHFLGTSSILLSDGETRILADGFVTRPGLLRVLFGRIAPDPAAVRAAVQRLDARALAMVFCAHTHFDHALDAPVWCTETGADLVGSESTINVGRGLGVPDAALKVVGDGDRVTYGRFEIRFVDSVHSPGDHYPGTVDRPFTPPARAGAWKTGSAFSVHITHPLGRILVHASANHRPGMLTGYRADVVYLGVGVLGRQSAEFTRVYWDEVVGATGARRAVLIHWDDLVTGLDRPLRPLPYLADRFDRCLERLRPLAERDGVELVLPVAWEPSDPFAGLVVDQP